MGLITCQGCEQIIGDGQSTCPHCGTSTPTKVKKSEDSPLKLVSCEDCGREVSRRARTCPHCGAPVDAPEPSQPKATSMIQDALAGRSARKRVRKMSSSGSSGFGCLGVFLVFAGILVGGYFLIGYDTTVIARNLLTGESLGRVNNIGLMNNRSVAIIVAVGVFVVGAIMASRSNK